MLPLGVAVWVVLEIWLLVLIGGAAGGFTVFLLLAAAVVAGGAVIKRAGRRAFRNLNRTLKTRGAADPQAEQHDEQHTEGNGLLMLAGLLLIVPGPLSDVLGLLLLVPPVRQAVSRAAERMMERRLRTAVPGTWGDAFQQARMHQKDGKVVQGEVVQDDEPPTRRNDSGPRPPLTG
ncbi:membrane protein [Streptomyces sulfonofaciens]|uniref:Membrane protein n=1 Tax=Streptomyces sulfonofaciens TaxID=68272 RepID=A0A919KWG6_9ACTN|nr:membrane protein [Streptomyces sulfonofaciens]